MDEMQMTRPHLRERIPSHTGRVMLKSEFRFVLMTPYHCSFDMRWNMPSFVMPALFTRMSTGRSSASTLEIPAAQDSKSDTSHLYVLMPVCSVKAEAAWSLPA